MKTRFLAAAAISLVIGSGVAAAAQHVATMRVALHSVDAGHTWGTAMIVYNSTTHRTVVTLSAHGLTPGLHLAHIHVGHCGKNGDIKYPLAPITASRAGTGASVTTFPYALTGASLYVNIHGVPGKVLKIIACGNLS